MNSQIQYRSLKPNDAEAFKKLRVEAVTKVPEAYFWTKEEEENQSTDSIIKRICGETPEEKRCVFGAFDTDELIGMAAFYRQKPSRLKHKGELWAVYVKPEYRNQGIATKLVVNVIDYGKSIEGIKQINLEVSDEGVRKLYESLGFETWGFEKACTLVDGKPVHWYHMSLTLDKLM